MRTRREPITSEQIEAVEAFVTAATGAGWHEDALQIGAAYERRSGPVGSYTSGVDVSRRCAALGVNVAPALDWAFGR